MSVDLLVENVNAALGSVRSDMDNMSRRLRKLEAVDLVPAGGGAPVPHAIPIAAGFHSGALPVTDLDGYVQGRIIRGGVADWEVYDASTANFILQGDGLDVVSVAFDWDNMAGGVGADMVHDHSAPGEGGVLPIGSITAHPLLGAQHTATVAQAPTRGSLVYGNAAGNWDELVLGAAFTHLESDGTDVAWQQNITMLDDATIGLNAGGNLTFDSTPATDVLNFASCNVGVNEVVPGARLHVSAATATDVGLIVQTTDDNAVENLVEIHDSGGNALSGVQAYGVPFCDLNIDPTSTFFGNLSAGGVGVTGVRNTFYGNQAGFNVTTGTDNVFIGSVAAGVGVVTGGFNVAIGSNALRNLTSGSNNFGLGRTALNACTTSSSNVAIGDRALPVLMTGAGSNVGVGGFSLFTTTTAHSNVGVGSQTLSKNITGNQNVGIGTAAGKMNETGSKSIYIGDQCASSNVASNRSSAVIIGPDMAKTTLLGLDNILAIGNSDTETPLILGDFTAGLTFHSQAAAAVAVAIQGFPVQADHLLVLQTSAPASFFESSTGLTGSTTTWNVQGVDIDYYIQAFGVADAFFLRGSDGRITLGALGLGFVQSTAGGVLSSAAIGAGDLPAHTHSGVGQGGSLAVGTTDTDATAGSVFFAGVAGVIQEDPNFFYDDGNNRLGIGTAAPSYTLETVGPIVARTAAAPPITNIGGGAIIVTGTSPTYWWYDTDEGAGDRAFRAMYTGESVTFASLNDAGTVVDVDDILVLNRDGYVGVHESAPTTWLFITANRDATGPPCLVLSAAGEGELATPDGERLRVGHWNAGATTFTERWTMDAAGQMGIGIDSPSATVDITASDPDLYLTNSDAANVANTCIMDFRLNSDVVERSYLRIMATSQIVADATRKSLVEFNTNDAGTWIPALAIHGHNIGIGPVAPAAQLDVDQSAAAGAQPVLRLDQADQDYVLAKVVGTSNAADADFTLVDAGDFGTPGAIVGWIQIEVEDTRAAGIADGDFYIPIYAVPT